LTNVADYLGRGTKEAHYFLLITGR